MNGIKKKKTVSKRLVSGLMAMTLAISTFSGALEGGFEKIHLDSVAKSISQIVDANSINASAASSKLWSKSKQDKLPSDNNKSSSGYSDTACNYTYYGLDTDSKDYSVFCADINKKAAWDYSYDLYTVSVPRTINLTKGSAKEKAIGMISYYGYPFCMAGGVSKNKHAFCATQALIWEILEGKTNPTTFKNTGGHDLYVYANDNYNSDSNNGIKRGEIDKAKLSEYYWAIVNACKAHESKGIESGKTYTMSYRADGDYAGKYTCQIQYSIGFSNIESQLNAAGITLENKRLVGGTVYATAISNSAISGTKKVSVSKNISTPSDTVGYKRWNKQLRCWDISTKSDAQPFIAYANAPAVKWDVSFKTQDNGFGGFKLFKEWYVDNEKVTADTNWDNAVRYRLKVLGSTNGQQYVYVTGDGNGNYTFQKFGTDSASYTRGEGPNTLSVNASTHAITVSGLPAGYTYQIEEVVRGDGGYSYDQKSTETKIPKYVSQEGTSGYTGTGTSFERKYRSFYGNTWSSAASRIAENKFGDDVLSTVKIAVSKNDTKDNKFVYLKNTKVSQKPISGSVKKTWDGVTNGTLNKSVYFLAYINANLGDGGVKKYYLTNNCIDNSDSSGNYKYSPYQTSDKQIDKSSWSTDSSKAKKLRIGNPNNGVKITDVPITYNGSLWNTSDKIKVYFEEKFDSTNYSSGPAYAYEMDDGEHYGDTVFDNKSTTTELRLYKTYKTENMSKSEPVANAVYELYRTTSSIPAGDVPETGYVPRSADELWYTGATDESGYIHLPEEFKVTYADTQNYKWFWVEKEAPVGFVFDSDVHEVDFTTINTLSPATINGFKNGIETKVTETKKSGSITIHKLNDLGDPVSGISFDIVLDMPEADAEGNSMTYKFDTPYNSGETGYNQYYYNGTSKSNGDVLATITTDVDGNASISDLPLAYCEQLNDYILQVKLVETSKQSPYVVLDEERVITLKASESTDASAKYVTAEETVVNVIQRGKLVINKTDALTGDILEGAKFQITAAEQFKIGDEVVHEKGEVIGELETDENGEAYTYVVEDGTVVKEIPLYVGAKYLIKEIEAPEGYQLSDETKTVEFEWDDTEGMYYHDFREVEFEDERKTVSVDVHKHEEGTGEDTWLANAEFELRAYDPVTIEMPDGTKKSFTKGQVIGYAKTIDSGDDKGTSKFYDLPKNIRDDTHEVEIPVGFKYQIVETKAPTDYKLDPTPEVFTVEAGENASVVIVRMYDALAGVKVSIKKIDKNNNEILIPNAEFTVYADEDMKLLNGTSIAKGDVVTTLVTGDDGTATSGMTLPAGKKFIVKETKAPEGYLLDEANTASFTTTANETTEIPVMLFNFEETVQPLTVNVLKIDKDMKDKFDTEHPLANAEISIYANEDNVISYDGETTYKKGDLIQTVTTAADGRATFNKVRSGYDYYIKETKAPAGYELNDTVIEIPNTYDPTKDSITVNHTLINTHHNVEVHIVKKSSDGDLPVEGAEFTLYADENIYYADGTTLMWAKDAAIAVATSDAYGVATFPVEIPVGAKYYVKETGIPTNYVKAGDKWSFVLDEDFAKDYISKTIYNDWQNGEITVLKLDGEDGTPLANAKFDLIAAEEITRGENHYSEGDVIASVTTGNDGTATFDVRVPVGFRYTVKETKAPEGYVNAEGVSETFELGYDATVEYVSVTKTFTNDYQKGIITVIKKDSETGTYLNGAEFALYADEDVRLASGSILYSKGQEIERFKTGDTMADGTSETGVIKFGVRDDGTGKLPVNYSYRIKETVPPANYVKSDFEQVITLEYSATVEYVSATTSVDNDYQQGSIKVFKTDGKTARKLADAKFTLYADEDVKLADGTIKYSKGTAIETIITNTDGEATFTKVPVGFKYKVVETEAPKGYKNKHPEKVIDLAYDVNVEFVEETVSVENTPNEIYFSKKKLADNKELSGATMEVRNSTTNELIDTWVSDGTDHLIERIPAGSYNFIEKAAPNGYVIATTIPFTIDEEGNVTSGTVTVESKDVDGKVHPLITMLDDATKIDIYKVDKAEFASGNAANLAGAKLQLFDGNTLIEEWITTTEAHRFDAVLTAGKTYRIHEAEPPAGYVLRTDDVTFTVGTDGQRQNVYVENEEVELHVSKKDITNGEELPNAELKVTNKETGEIIDSWTSSDTAHVIHKIPAGTYILTETGAPEGYLISNEVEFTVDNLNRVQHVEMVDDVNKIDVFKLDRDTEAKVAGAKLKLTATKAGSKLDISDVIVTAPTGKESTVVREDNTITWVSGTDACTFKRLPNGEYEISEIEAPESYAVATGTVKFKVVDNKVVNTENASITSVNFYNGKSKVNIIKSYKFMIAPAAAGAEFTLTSDVDVDGSTLKYSGLVDIRTEGKRKLIFKSETPSADGDFTMSIVGLPNGNYTVTETGVPEGFLEDDTVYEFSIEDGYFVYNGVKYDGADEGSIGIENDYSEFSVAKVDDNGTALAGAVLALYDENENEIARWTTDGTVKTFKALPYGTYTVKELKAPNRYNTAKPVVIEHNGEVNGVTYNVVNYHGIVMPQTGGNGLTNVLTFFGTLLTSLSVLYFALRRKREF